MYSVTNKNYQEIIIDKSHEYLKTLLFIAIAIKIFGGPIIKILFLLLKIKVVFLFLEALLFKTITF